MATFNAMEVTELWASEHSICTRIARAISGRVCLTVCGNGNLVPLSFIRWRANRTVYELSLKTRTGRSSSDGKEESTDSLTEKLSPIPFVALPSSSGPRECSATEMAVCGSELRTEASCTYTREGQMYLRSRTDSRV